MPRILSGASDRNRRNAFGRDALAAVIRRYAGVPYVSLSFNRSCLATDLTYRVEASSDLAAGTEIARSAGGAAATGAGFVRETETAATFLVEARDTQPANGPPGIHRFLRLRVTTP